MNTLHIVQGGIDNGDKALLEKGANKKGFITPLWVAPKSAMINDDVVIFIKGYGFFATGVIHSIPQPRIDWPNRHGSRLSNIKLIQPAISLESIRKEIPELTWANYPRSITTPKIDVAEKIRKLISLPYKTEITSLDEKELLKASKDELRKIALMNSSLTPKTKEQKVLLRVRSEAIKIYVLKRSDGVCEGCNKPAPFKKPDGSPYLEAHHTQKLSDDGPDHPKHVIALCPNCHRKAHYSADAKSFNAQLTKKLNNIEKK